MANRPTYQVPQPSLQRTEPLSNESFTFSYSRVLGRLDHCYQGICYQDHSRACMSYCYRDLRRDYMSPIYWDPRRACIIHCYWASRRACISHYYWDPRRAGISHCYRDPRRACMSQLYRNEEGQYQSLLLEPWVSTHRGACMGSCY